MKIAFFSDTFIPSVNGIATYLKTMSESLAENGHSIYIFTPKVNSKHSDIFKHKNIHVHFLPSIPSYFYHDFRISPPLSVSLLAEMYEVDPDVIHFHTPFAVGAQAIFIAKMLKKPLVATFHGYFWEPEYLKLYKLDKFDKGKTISNLGWKYNNFFLGQADVILSPSERSKQDLLEHDFKKPVKVISNGIDTSAYTKSELFHHDVPKKYFVYSGRVSLEKSLHILIKAFSLFAEKNEEVDLVIVGDGPARKKVEKVIKEYNLGERVHMLGMMDHAQLIHSNILHNAIAFVTTSKSESQPVSILEALAVKLPIIGVNERGIPELIKNNGIICEADNYKEFSRALEKVATDKELRDKMSHASFEMAKEHSLEESTKKLLNVYEEAIKEKEGTDTDAL
jgi:1,2-diacylglycerol 3-alpha-glucosyltransferase